MKAIFAGLLILFTVTVSVAADAPDTAPLNQLIDEVRQLRLTLQQTLPLQMRTQVLLERIRQQRDVIGDLKQALDIARQESINEARQRVDLEEQGKELETQLANEPANRENSPLKGELRGVRKAIEQTMVSEGQSRNKEVECQAALVKEEARMAELSASLEGSIAAIGSASVNGN